MVIVAKSFMVGIPIPSLDRHGDPLNVREVEIWTKRTLLELSQCFGGATQYVSPGTNRLGSEMLFEAGQVLVLSACDSRTEFLKYRDRVAAFAEKLRKALNQHSVIVLAFPSDSFLVELES